MVCVQPALRPYLWMILGAMAFAGMGTFTHLLRERCDWQIIALVRVFLSLILAGGMALWGGARLVFWRPGVLWLRSGCGGISLVCTFFALTRLPVADVLTLINMFPIWVALLSWPMLGEPPGTSVWIAVVSGTVGVAFIQQPHLTGDNIAVWVAFGSSLSTALAMMGLHRLAGVDARAVVVHFSLVGIVFAAAALFVFDRSAVRHFPWELGTLALLGAVGVSATIGQLCLTLAFASGPPAKLSVVSLSQIVFALFLEVFFWHRAIHPLSLVGMALIVSPTAWVLYSTSSRLTPAPLGPGPADAGPSVE